ncbi:hypothetical protein LUZ63_019081 [Rhynchospora breviuscula]|uniref:KIB1-4 beta-propeller domain-containing protein n=1 Tax=Rhynchospora breviuscula TaxID=2022672 RepID=A0A9Q0C5J5_9POAL|nr:hypothetical protein LUZ63_019081 [Rhynchospora breviuscula]
MMSEFQKKQKVQNNRQADEEQHEELRDWSGLMDELLQLIFHALLLSTKKSSFSKVCRAWRRIASSKEEIVASQPPFLLVPSFISLHKEGYKTQQRPFKILSPASIGTDSFAFSAHCFLAPSQLHLCDRLAHAKYMYSSKGYLIIVEPTTNCPILLDPFTGEEFRPFPSLPRVCPSGMCRGDGNCRYGTAVLLGSPPSRCRIVILSDYDVLWTCLAGQHQWSNYVIDYACWEKRPNGFAVVRDTLYSITRDADLMVFDFDAGPQIRVVDRGDCDLPKQFLNYHYKKFPYYGPFITQSHGEVFLVRLNPFPTVFSDTRVEVYRLQEWKWMRMNRLDNAALFLDIEGSAMYCRNPAWWGGKENHVYLTGRKWWGVKENHVYSTWQKWDKWISFSLDDIVDLGFKKPIKCYAKWPRPLWMLPSSCY